MSVESPPRLSLTQIAGYFVRLGTTGFGGPIALAGYMQRDLVERRHWFTQEEYLQGLAVSQTLPGPLAAQLAMWLGYVRRGFWGACAAAVPFILPPFVIVSGVAALYVAFRGTTVIQALFYGHRSSGHRADPSGRVEARSSDGEGRAAALGDLRRGRYRHLRGAQ